MIRYLGPEDFGSLSYALSLVGLFTAIATLGLDSIVTRELVKDQSSKNELLGTVFTMRIWGGVAAVILLGVTMLLTGDNPRTQMLIAVIGISLIVQAFLVIEFYFQAIVQIKYTAIVQITNLVITGVLKVVLVLLKADLFWFAVCTLLESIIAAMGFIYVYRKQNLKLRDWKYSKEKGITLLRDSWPLIFSGVVIAIYLKIDQVLIKKMLSVHETGLYASAVRLCESWYFIPMAVSSSLFPAIMNAKKMNRELYLSRLQKLYDILAWLAIGISIPVSFFATDIMTLLFGAKFVGASMTLTIYIWAGVPTFLGVGTSQFLIAENLTRMSFYRTLAGMLMNVVLNLWWISVFGINGSAAATLVSYSVATFSIGASRKTYTQLWMMVKAVLFIDLFIFIYKIWQKRLQPK